jgi:TctA family transporter
MGFILGFILGGLVDREFVKTFLLFGDDPLALFARPAFDVLLALTIGSVAFPKLIGFIRTRRRQQA